MAQLQPLDRRRWTGLWNRLGAQGDGLSVLTGLEAAYAEPARAYHTADHIRPGTVALAVILPRMPGRQVLAPVHPR